MATHHTPPNLHASRQFRRQRLWYMLLAFCCGIACIGIRLLYLQISQHLLLHQMGQKNFLRVQIIPPLRGNLLDYQGRLLATNRPVFDLYWQGTGGVLTRADELVLERLQDLVTTSSDLIKPVKLAHRAGKRLLLATDLPFNQVCQLSELCHDGGSLLINNRFTRIYPHQSLASHILGYLGRQDTAGRQGLEKTFNEELRGHPGRIIQTINSSGKSLSETLEQEAQHGQDCQLTIDLDLQALAHEVFPAQEAGALIIMEPETGAIRAMLSNPVIDPNLFLRPLSQDIWDNYHKQDALLNRATCGLYPPASTFKLVTMAAGLEAGIVKPDSQIMCRGYVTFGGRRYSCMKKEGHGLVSMREALSLSCNIHWWHIAKHLHIDQLATYAHFCGFGSKTGFLLPEVGGLVPTSQWKRVVFSQPWWRGETLSVAIGQGYLLVTPLQVIRMMASICTGFLVKPRIAAHEAIETTPLVLQQSTLEFLRHAMNDAALEGTARSLRTKHMRVWAKTGTAQTCPLLKEKTCKQDFEHAWVAGYFQYQDEKPLAFAVLVEHVGSTKPGLATMRHFMQRYGDLRKNQQSSP